MSNVNVYTELLVTYWALGTEVTQCKYLCFQEIQVVTNFA